MTDKKCKICGCNLYKLMGKNYENGICQNCESIQKMNNNGDLAKNGLMTTDFY